MSWVKACIKHKLLIYILAIGLCLFGLYSLYVVPIAPFPKLKLNKIDIELSYPGASASTIQTMVTDKLVNALKSVNNIQNIAANSQPGNAEITLTLVSNSQNDVLETQIKIMQAIATSHLPLAVPQPQVTQLAGNSGLITFIVSSKQLSLFQLDNFIQSKLYPKFRSLPDVSVYASSQNPIIKVSLIPEQLARFKLSTLTVDQRLNQSFQSSPMGELAIQQHRYLLSVKDQLNSLNKLKNLVIARMPGTGDPVYLKDIAQISFMPRSVIPDYYSSFDGHTADNISLNTTSQANPLQVAKVTLAYVNNLKSHLPDNIKITPVFNAAKNMHAAINDVVWTILIASLLVFIITFLFLGHLRTTLIPIITIPICLFGSIGFVTLIGYSVNILTLLALVIAVGLVVDDAIVIVENITRLLESGVEKAEAIIVGTSRIALTIIAITLTLLAIYLPIVFCHGPFVSFLKAFTMPLASAVFISGIVALTLTPVISCVLLDTRKLTKRQIKFNLFFKHCIKYYQKLLKHVLAKPYLSLTIIIILVAIFSYFSFRLPHSFFPNDPDGIVNILLKDTGTDNFATLKARAALFKKFYQSKDVNNYILNVMHDPVTGQVEAGITIAYKKQYLHQTLDFANQINAYIKAKHIKEADASIEKFSNWGNGYDLSFTLYGDDSLENIQQIALVLSKKMKNSGLYNLVNNTISQPHKQLQFSIDSAKAAKFGIFRNQVTQLLSTYYGGYTLDNNFNIEGLSVPVVVQLNNNDLQAPNSLQKLLIQSHTTNKFYPLDDFVTLNMVAKPVVISTFNGFPSVTINAMLAKGHSLSEAINYTNNLTKNYAPLLHYQYTGNAKAYLDGNKQTYYIVGFGILCIYLLLAILFGSLLEPFIILLSVPFAVIGGALSLYLVDSSINLYSVLALITLIGLITKHGVLIVEFANKQLQTGKGVVEAILIATERRFRPIIMTTLVMTLGALPLVFSNNLMYVARRDLGIVLIGGLIIGTLFSLFVVPLFFTLLKKNVD